MTRARGVGQVYGERHPACRLTEARVIRIRRAARQGRPLLPFARQYRVKLNTISQAAHGRTWKHLNRRYRPARVDLTAVARRAQRARCRGGR